MLVGVFFNNYHCYIYSYLYHSFCLSSFSFSLIFIFITAVYATDNTTVINKPSVTYDRDRLESYRYHRYRYLYS